MRVEIKAMGIDNVFVKNIRCWIDDNNVIRAMRACTIKDEDAGQLLWTIHGEYVGCPRAPDNLKVATKRFNRDGKMTTIIEQPVDEDIYIDGVCYDINGNTIVFEGSFGTRRRIIKNTSNIRAEQIKQVDQKNVDDTSDTSDNNIQRSTGASTTHPTIQEVPVKANNDNATDYNHALQRCNEFNKRLDSHYKAYYNLTASMVWTKYLNDISCRNMKSSSFCDPVILKSWHDYAFTDDQMIIEVSKMLREKHPNKSKDCVTVSESGYSGYSISIKPPNLTELE